MWRRLQILLHNGRSSCHSRTEGLPIVLEGSVFAGEEKYQKLNKGLESYRLEKYNLMLYTLFKFNTAKV